MAASLLRTRSVNSRDIKFELEATMVVHEKERAAVAMLGPTVDVPPTAKRLWKELQEEMISLEGLYLQATGVDFQPPPLPPEHEMAALKTFFEAMHGRRWLDLTGWLGRKGTANTRGVLPFACNPWCWAGVEVGVGDVQGLSLAGNQLQGDLPGPSLAALKGLVTLDLSNNEIEGVLPFRLCELTNLQYLRLGVTKLEGPIPASFGELKGLRELNLSYGNLSGTIPSSLGSCVKLTMLNISHNKLEGPIPPELSALSGLRELSLEHNRLTGVISPSFGQLFRLRALNLSCNFITGPLGPWVGELTNLKRLLLDHNALTGSIPRSLASLHNLEVLHLQFNNLTGKIPGCFGALKELRVVNLSRNELEGKVPEQLADMTKLAGLELGCNSIVGPLPKALGRLSRLVDLHVMEGCPSYSLPARRGFTRHAFNRIFVQGPELGLNNTTYPHG